MNLPNRYTYGWAALLGAAIAVETVALTHHHNATLTAHIRAVTRTHPRRVLLTAGFAWAAWHLTYQDHRRPVRNVA